MLSRDENHAITQLRSGFPIGGWHEAEPSTGWHRLMPSDVDGEIVDEWKLNIGNLRSDVLDLAEWNIVIWNEGYYQQNIIGEYHNGVASMLRQMKHIPALRDLGNHIRWTAYPTMVLPLSITYYPTESVPDNTINIGFAKEDAFDPTPKKYAELASGQMLIMNTTQVHKIFYEGAALVADRIMWGEHFLI